MLELRRDVRRIGSAAVWNASAKHAHDIRQAMNALPSNILKKLHEGVEAAQEWTDYRVQEPYRGAARDIFKINFLHGTQAKTILRRSQD